MKNTLKETIFNRLKFNNLAFLFLNELMSEANVYLFGGAVRDYLSGNIDNARDLDFVVESKKNNSYIDISKYIYKEIKYTKNRFGGYKITFNNHLTIDIWDIQDTWAFKTNKFIASPTNLLKTVYLNIDSLVYCMNTDQYIDNCNKKYFMIMEKGIIDIVFEENPQIELNLLRALVLRNKYNMKFSEKLQTALSHYIKASKGTALSTFLNLQLVHYKRILLEENDLKYLLEKYSR